MYGSVLRVTPEKKREAAVSTNATPGVAHTDPRPAAAEVRVIGQSAGTEKRKPARSPGARTAELKVRDLRRVRRHAVSGSACVGLVAQAAR